MRVFLSWSGGTSRQIAEIFYAWIPKVLQAIEPFLSSQDIEKGERWLSSISTNLENIDVGIVVITKSNIGAPWINFEAGALSKKIDRSRIIPVLFGITDADLVGHPLAQFQYVKLEKEDLLRLFRMLNLSCPKPLNDAPFEETFSLWFDRHYEQLQKIKPPESEKKQKDVSGSNENSEIRLRRMESAIDEILNYQRRSRHALTWEGGAPLINDPFKTPNSITVRVKAKEGLSYDQAKRLRKAIEDKFKKIEISNFESSGMTFTVPKSVRNMEAIEEFRGVDGFQDLLYEIHLD